MTARILRHWLLAASVVSALGCGAVASAATPPARPARSTRAGPCSDFERDIERVWNVDRKAQVKAAFVGLGVEYAERVVERVSTKMDDVTADWVMLSERACKDFMVRKALSRREYVARTTCFDSALIRQRMFVRMLAAPTKAYAANALTAFEELSAKLDECEAVALAREEKGAPGPRANPEVEALSAEALLAARLGDPLRAQHAAARAAQVAHHTGDDRVIVESLLAGAVADLARARFSDAKSKLRDASERAGAAGARMPLSLAYQYTGQVHQCLHEYELAIAAYERALQVRRELLPPEHPLTAWLLDNLGSAIRAQGDPRRAIELHERALSSYRRHPGAYDARVSDALNNLGLAWAEVGDHARAVGYYKQALALDRPSAHDDRPGIADTFNNLALAFRDGGELGAALEACARALAIYREAYGPAHPSVARALRNLGSIHLAAGALDAAEQALEQSLVASSADDRGRADALNDLGMIWGRRGEYPRAAAAFQQALAIRQSAGSHQGESIADLYSNLGLALEQSGRPDAAIDALHHALQRYERVLEAHHPRIIDTLEHLGFALRSRGDCTNARQALQRAHALSESAFGPSDRHTLHLQAAAVAACQTLP